MDARRRRTTDIEAIAIYTALIRHELGLTAGSDALADLEARLWPDNPERRVPARAPAVRRLKLAARRLRRGAEPDETLEALAEDLRFLRLFEDTGPLLSQDGLAQLLDDVRGIMPPKPSARRSRKPTAGRDVTDASPKDKVRALHPPQPE